MNNACVLKTTCKEYLSQIFWLDSHINCKLEQVRQLRELSVKATSNLNNVWVDSTRSVSKLEDRIIKIVDLETEINDEIDRLVDLKAEIIGVISKIENPDFRLLLELRYLCLKTWEQIAQQMNYTYRHIHRLHEQAIKSVGF